ncbi:MAG: (4Fe-4S)-binding protein [Mucinivorans sp.]
MPHPGRNRIYSNGQITVVWQGAQCTHASICYTKLRAVFDPIKRPWIKINGATTEEIIAIVEECPSSALTFFWNDEPRNATEKSPKLFRGSVAEVLARNTPKDPSCAASVNFRGNDPKDLG